MAGQYQIEHRFWMVYVEGHTAPAKKYESQEEAIKEAQRLCVKEHRNAYVLQASSGFFLPEPECGVISLRDEVSDEE